jgi:hypothetical protein
MRVSAKQAVSQVWHVDIVPQYGPSRMDEAKALRRANMHAELAEGQAKKKKKSPSHSIQRSLFAH